MYELFEWVDNLDWFSSLLGGAILMVGTYLLASWALRKWG